LEQPPLVARQKFRGTTQHRITTILGLGHDRALAEMPGDSDSLHSHISIDGAPQWVHYLVPPALIHGVTGCEIAERGVIVT
jgi:hypothetical protein